jgi:hypothetical protein
LALIPNIGNTLENLNASYNMIPMEELDDISNLISTLRALKTLDLYGNPLAEQNDNYKYRISSSHPNLERLDGLNLKAGSFLRERLDTIRKEWETARLVDSTHESAKKWIDAERQVKFAAMDMLSQR